MVDLDALKARVEEFDAFLNEPPQFEDQRMVRDYRHSAHGEWRSLRDALPALIAELEAARECVRVFRGLGLGESAALAAYDAATGEQT